MSHFLTIAPDAATTWAHDVFGNAVALDTFANMASTLVIDSIGDILLNAVDWPVFDIAASAFVPPPKVTSTLLRLVPRAAPLACDADILQRVTAAAFGQRRKMLRQSLRSLGADPLALLDVAKLDPTARAEDIPVEGFVALARVLADIGRVRVQPP